jgi:hypothetical protein
MRNLLALLPILVLLFASAGCATAPTAEMLDAEPVPGVALQERDEEVGEEIEPEDKGPGVGDYALVLPKNIVWIPWKTLAGTGKGLVDGVAAGFDDGRVPLLGLLFSPLNAVMGLVTGFGTGLFGEPGFVGPRTNFGRTMGLPLQRPTPIWWLPE